MTQMTAKPGGSDPDTAVIACWSCEGPVPGAALFCATCRAVQPPGTRDHFQRLGLPRSFAIDIKDLDRRYFALQRQLHPDRFATRTPRERAVSQSQAVSLNEAYEVLRDPVARGEYLLRLHGVDVNPDGCNTVRDPTLLMEQMERREALMEASTPREVDAIVREASGEVEVGVAAIAAAFAAGDIDRAGRETTRLKYLAKLLDEARQRKTRLASVA